MINSQQGLVRAKSVASVINNHDALVEACEAALPCLKALSGYLAETVRAENTCYEIIAIDLIKAALEKAKGV